MLIRRKHKAAASLAAVALFIMCAAPAAAVFYEGTLEITVSRAQASPGDIAELEVYLCNNPGVVGLRATIDYDPEALTLIEMTDCGVLGHSSFVCDDELSAVPMTVLWERETDEENASSAGMLLRLRFRVAVDARGEYPVTFTVADHDSYGGMLADIKCETTGGAVVVSPDSAITYGDADENGLIDLLDVAAVKRWLAGWPLAISRRNADVDLSGAADLRDAVLIKRWLAGGWDVVLGKDGRPGALELESFVYGRSEQGRELLCRSITPPDHDRTVLLVFAIHGFEDDHDRDGGLLVNAAETVYRAFADGRSPVGSCRLLIVPYANPDGLYAGMTNNGFGRCNANGVDLNRDFDAGHVVRTASRNRTLSPFSASESVALAALVEQTEPHIVVDFHGWLNMTIGDGELAEVFAQELDLSNKCGFSASCGGYFSYWAHMRGAQSLLVEFKDTEIPTEQLIVAVERLVLR